MNVLRGQKLALDQFNKRGGVEGRKIVGLYADAQSKTDVAINETERLLNERGYTLGHFPQSYEQASLGGYIATRSAGRPNRNRA